MRVLTGVAIFFAGAEVPAYRMDPKPPPAMVLPVGDPVRSIGPG